MNLLLLTLLVHLSIGDVVHYHGYEANGRFIHIQGSAWDPNDWRMLPNIANGSADCEHQCQDRIACNAFVFSPSTNLCFLIHLDLAGKSVDSYQACRRLANDRVFGIVRTSSNWTLLSEADGYQNHIGNIPMASGHEALWLEADDMAAASKFVGTTGFSCVLVVGVTLFGVGFGKLIKIVRAVHGFPRAQSSSIAASIVCTSCIYVDFASSMAVLVMATFFAVLCLLWLAATASPRPRIQQLESAEATWSEEVFGQYLGKPADDRTARTPRNDIGWAGPTNYPVLGAVSPTAKGVVAAPLTTFASLPDAELRVHAGWSTRCLQLLVQRERLTFAALLVLCFASRYLAVYAVIGCVIAGRIACTYLQSWEHPEKVAQEMAVRVEEVKMGPSLTPNTDPIHACTPITGRSINTSSESPDDLSPPKAPREIVVASMRCKLAYDSDGNIIDQQKDIAPRSSVLSRPPRPLQ